MTSQKQIIANRKNAQKSIGPKTPQGKAVVAQNALKHGLLSQQILLPDESNLQLDEFRSQLISQLAPVGELEALLADRLIAAAWRLRRLLRIETEMMTEDLNQKIPQWELNHIFGTADKNHKQTLGAALARKPTKIDTYDKLRRYEAHIERSLFRALHELQKIQTIHPPNTLMFPAPLNFNLATNTKTAL